MSHFYVELFAVAPELLLLFIHLANNFNRHSYSNNTIRNILSGD